MKVCANKCSQCLFSDQKIVSDNRRKQILRGLRSSDGYFICHKSPEGIEHVCHGSYLQMPQMVRIAGRLGMIEFVQPNEETNG